MFAIRKQQGSSKLDWFVGGQEKFFTGLSPAFHLVLRNLSFIFALKVSFVTSAE